MISNQMAVVEHVKLLKRQLTWVVIGVPIALSFLQALVQYVMARTSPDATEEALNSLLWPAAIPGILGSTTQMGWGQLVVIVLFGAVIAQEYNWRTLHMWLARGVPRSQFIAAKASAFLPVSLAIVVLPLILVGCLTAVFTVISTGGLDVSQIDALRLALATLATAYILLPYAALMLPLAVASRSTIAPIGGGIAFFFVEAMFQAMSLPGAAYTPAALGSSLRTLLPGIVRGAEAAQASGAFLDPATAAAGVGLWVLAFVGLAYLLLRRQDVTE